MGKLRARVPTKKIRVPDNLSCNIMDAIIDREVFNECVRRYENGMKEEGTKLFEKILKDNSDIIDCEFALAAIEIGYARGNVRLTKFLDAQHKVEERLTNRFATEIVFGAEKGTDEYNRREDILTVAKQELLSYGFDYDEYRKKWENNNEVDTSEKQP
jgi:hypothetical protein